MMTWLIGIGLWGVFVLFAWALCVVAGRADDEARRMAEEWTDRRL